MSGPVTPGTVLAVSRGGAQDDRRVCLAERCVSDPQTVSNTRTEALDHHVGFRDESQEGVPAVGGLEVEQRPGHATVARVGIERRGDLHTAGAGHRTDLGDRSPVVSEDPRGARGRPDRRKVENTHPLERWSHCAIPQKFLGRPRPRRAMMLRWISEAPPPMVSITV